MIETVFYMQYTIEAEIQRVKLEIEQNRLLLRQVNTTMASIRAHYQQEPAHGRTLWLGKSKREIQRSRKDADLQKHQPVKEKLQQEKLTLEQYLSQLKLLKAQGVTHIAY